MLSLDVLAFFVVGIAATRDNDGLSLEGGALPGLFRDHSGYPISFLDDLFDRSTQPEIDSLFL